MKAKKYLSEGGAQALMVICGGLLLLLLFCSPVATTCAGFATCMLIMLPRVMGTTYRSQPGFGLVAGLPVIVGFMAQPGVFIFSAMFTWFLLLGLAESGSIQRAQIKAKK